MDLRALIGQKLVIGFDGTEIPDELRELVRHYRIGNVILFRRNTDTAAQTRRLCAEIRELILKETGYPPFIMIDEEGGMVTRMPRDIAPMPGNMAVAATGDPENAYTAARITARRLRRLGVNFNLAPVLDINSNPANPVIGVRSFGDTAERVITYASQAIRGYGEERFLCCGKHFPGHGDTATDSHLGLPRVGKTAEELRKTELKPFAAAVREGIPAIMTAHILYPEIEPEALPATMSRRIMTGLLREELGFEGLILSDCLTMNAIREHYGVGRGAAAAAAAGVDLRFVSHDPQLQAEAAETMLRAAESGAIGAAELQASAERILRYKAEYADIPAENSAPDCAADRSAAETIARRAATLVSGTPFRADSDTFFCGCRDYRLTQAMNDPGNAPSSPGYLAGIFGGGFRTVGDDPDPEEIRETVRAAQPYGKTVMLMLNAYLRPGQTALLRALAETGKPVIAAAMRAPYDLADLPENVIKLALYDLSDASLCALADILRGAPCSGSLPVTVR